MRMKQKELRTNQRLCSVVRRQRERVGEDPDLRSTSRKLVTAAIVLPAEAWKLRSLTSHMMGMMRVQKKDGRMP